MALKGNQSSLHDDVCLHFEQPAPASLTRMTRAETVDKGHGRIEIRQCRVSTDIDWLRVRHPEWKNLGSIEHDTKKKRMTIKRMRKAAGWDDSVLTDILAQVF